MVRETTKVKINCTVDADLATLLEQEGFRKRSEIVNAALRAYYENISDRRRAQKLALEVARKEVAFKEAEARLYSAKLDLDLSRDALDDAEAATDAEALRKRYEVEETERAVVEMAFFLQDHPDKRLPQFDYANQLIERYPYLVIRDNVDLVKAAEERLKCAPLVMVQDLGQR